MQVQVEITQKLSASAHCPPSRPGDKHWMDEKAARALIEANVARWIAGGAEEMPPEAGPLKRNPGFPIDRFSHVERAWDGETVVVVGGGPSVVPEQIARLEGRARVLAINNAYLIAPFADVLYFADSQWWEWHSRGIPTIGLPSEEVARRFAAFPGQRCTIFGTGMLCPDPMVHMLRVSEAKKSGLSSKPGELVTGGNSGYQALNLAWLAGARRILLVGFDMKFRHEKRDPDRGKCHWHEPHPTAFREESYRTYARKFPTIVPELGGVEVFNCSPDSVIECFPRGDLESLLAPA